ncbi:DMT family transporter [Marinobacter halodurans]|uniref:DMT family transporter n=1 Tax=Marinobacter halodurans TaxID=2528979 RepID=A0ABY1ZF20_9GAMM|nr:DMT family transporter [Marinobacter halodurans]TBW49127.1 DMT family transporter [Marinobacter halodurans]
MAKASQSHKAGDRQGLYAFGCLLLVGTFLALSLMMAKFADGAGAPRLTFLMVALAGAGIVLMLLTALQRQAMPFNRRTLEYALVTGVLLALPNALGFLAVRHVGAGFISLSFAFPILITWVMAVLLGMEALRIQRLLGVSLALVGGVILALSKAGSSTGDPAWAVLILAMPVVLAVGNIYRTRRWPVGTSPIFLAAIMLIGAALALLPFVWATEAGQFGDLFRSSTVPVLLGVETGVFSILYFFYFVLQKLAGPVYLSQIGTVAAVVGTLIAVLALGEPTPPNLALAGTLVAAGTVIFHRAARRSVPQPPAATTANS